MNAITPVVPAAGAVTVPPPDSLLNFVALAVRDPNIDVSKLETLLRMQREIIADDAKLQFNRAMSAVQSEMRPVVRDATNSQTRSKYARLETIDALMRPIYSRYGFHLQFNSEPIPPPNVRICCEVAHIAGHSKMFHLDASLDMTGPQGTPNKTALHGLGSSVSYLQRYLTRMIFNVVLCDQDDDGNGGPRNTALINKAQREELNGLMRETQTTEAKFLSFMSPALRSIEETPVSDFPRLRNALLTKKSILAQRAAANVLRGEAA